LLTELGWNVLFEIPQMLGMGEPSGASIWFGGATKDTQNDYDAPGLNHLGLHVDSIAAVDAAVAHIKELGAQPLFETPRHRPEFSGPDSTYYQVMFESPDRILFEVVYVGAK
jgi:catechol 2,3-dioxygenase-like lactoylglutathione lyase family enzyme